MMLKTALCGAIAMLMLTEISAAGSPLLGIDIGSEFMKIAIVQPGRPFQIVTNTATKRKTEVLVAFDNEGNRLFAGDGKNRFTRNPLQVYKHFRNLLGRTMDHPHAKHITQTFLKFFNPVVDETRGTMSFPAVDLKGENYHVEEILAMLLHYARAQGESFAEGKAKIKDCVITVPSFFTQFERQAVFDAAAIIDLHVLGLVDENSAAAVQYGIDKKHNGTYKVLFYNLGAEAAQATLAYYGTINTRKRGNNITASTFHIKGKTTSTGVGGSYLTNAVTNKFAELFNEQSRKKDKTYDVTTKARPMAKLFMSADKTKKVLSANEAIPVYVQSVDKDVDFKGTKMDRPKLEKMGEENLAKILDPIHAVLKDAGLEPTDVDVVELLGGGLRVPKVQKMLCELFHCDDKENGVETAVHLNGDEAMALGAAFIAANKSTAFVVRHVGLGDTCPFPVGVRLKQIGEEKDEKGKVWNKRAALYKCNNKLNSRKVVTFKYDKSFRVEVHYEKHRNLPEGTPKLLAAYVVEGLEDIAKNEKYKDLGTPKVKVSFFLDGNQMVSVLKAEAFLDETIEEEVEVEIKEEEEEKEGGEEGADKDGDEKKDDKEAEKKDDKEAEKKDDKEAEKKDDKEAEKKDDKEAEKKDDKEVEKKDDKDVEKKDDKEVEKKDDKEAEKKDDKESERKDDKEAEKKGDKEAEKKDDKEAEKKDDKEAEKKDDKEAEKKDDKEAEKKDDKEAEKKDDKEAEKKDDKEAEKKDDKDAEKKDDEEGEKKDDEETEKKDDEEGEKKDDKEAEKPKEKKYRKELRERVITHTVPLKLKSVDDVLEVKPMSKDHLKQAKARFKSYIKMERARIELATARNDLETLIYGSKERLNDNEDEVNKVTEEGWLEKYSASLTDMVDWIYFEDEANDILNVRVKSSEISVKVKSVFLKISESVDRPKAVKVATELLAATRTKMAAWPTNRPQVTKDEMQDLEDKMVKLENFLKEKTEAQSKVGPKEDAVFTSKDVANEIKGIGSLLKRLLKKAPLPPPEEDEDEDEVKVNATNATNTTNTTNTTAEGEEKDAPSKEDEGEEKAKDDSDSKEEKAEKDTKTEL